MMGRADRLFLCVVAAVGACGTSKGATGGHGGGGGSGPAGTGGKTHATCGNGSIDPGEDCEASNLNGATCASLGFQGGALGCAASCRFDTSSCSGPLTLTVNASRTACTAPCGVFFDATATTGLMGGDYVGANFNWDFDSTNVNPTGVHAQTIGFAVAHVFEVPGAYQVSVRVRDLAGKAGTTTIPVTVTAMTGPTLYVSTAGSDTNSGTTMGQPLATLAGALKHATAQTSILFRRGDTFNVGKTIALSLTGPILFGAYTDAGSSATAAPIWQSSVSGGYTDIADVQRSSDVRLTDLHVISTGSSGGMFMYNSSDTLIERVEIEGLGYVDNTNETVGENFYVDKTASRTLIVDCHLHDFIGYGLYGENVNQVGVIGTTIERFGGGDHGVRIAGGALSYVAENTVMSNDTNSALSALTFRGDNQNLVVVDNHTNRLVEFTPQNTSSVEHVMDALAEGNVINDDRPKNFYEFSLGISAQHVVARNNIFVNSPVAVGVIGQPQLPIDFIDQIFVYNNTSYFFPPAGDVGDIPANFVSHNGTAGSLVAQNNLFATGLPSSASKFMITDKMGTAEEDHNLCFGPNVSGNWNPVSGAGSIVGNPQFASTDFTTSNALQLSAGSAAIDVGTMTAAYQDLVGTARPQGAGWDIGAFELTP